MRKSQLQLDSLTITEQILTDSIELMELRQAELKKTWTWRILNKYITLRRYNKYIRDLQEALKNCVERRQKLESKHPAVD